MHVTDEEQDEQFYRDTESIAFPKLNDHQLSLLEPLGERRVMKRGDVLFKAGQRDLGLAIVLRGELEAFETRDGTEYNLATARERDFMGDVSMLQGTSILGSSQSRHRTRPRSFTFRQPNFGARWRKFPP